MMDKNQVISAYLYSRMDWNAGSITGEYLTHINYSFALVRDGLISAEELDKLDEIRLVKRRFPHLKVLISVGGWGADGFSDAALTDGSRSLFAKSAAEFIRQNSFDGIDIDWEYPCSSDAGIRSRPEDRENFNLLLEELRRELDRCGAEDGKRYLLTAALGGTAYTLRFYDLKSISGILDYMNLMTYDFAHGSSKETGHHTCLFGPKGKTGVPSADTAVKICLDNGIPADKLVLGCAFYGRGWDVADGSSNGLYASVTSECAFYSYRELVLKYIGKNGFRRYWDDCAKAPYLWNGKHFITYDDPESLEHKVSYVKTNGLGGVMFWELSQDHGDELLGTLFSKLK
ncbi:MAG TPA: glycoside hydrolase family 18 protein [Clostridiales bacterium]|nr:glycoside hydrolase family 18 protein [Clostridiales bacterium]HPP35740.1 glycoside hydrolase family 18 protein [Clostridiales bacterium]